MFSLFKKKSLLSAAENAAVVQAIREAELATSGEVRVFIESRNPLVDTLERARAIFFEEKMFETAARNGVLIYIALKDKEVAIFGDEGIHQAVGAEFWNQQIKQMLPLFKQNSLAVGLCNCIQTVGDVLKEKFPYQEGQDKNELPDDIIFGR